MGPCDKLQTRYRITSIGFSIGSLFACLTENWSMDQQARQIFMAYGTQMEEITCKLELKSLSITDVQAQSARLLCYRKSLGLTCALLQRQIPTNS